MEIFKEHELFTLEEAAKWCGMSRDAFYMRYRRGQIEPAPLMCHRLYFTRESIDEFRSKYCPFN